MIRTIASYIPPKWRAFIYSLLAAANMVILGLIGMGEISDPQWYAVGVLVANALGFGMAFGNTPKPAPDGPA